MAARGDILLQNALMLDIETSGLTRGAMVHELSLFDLNTRRLKEFTLTPSWVTVNQAISQDVVKFAESFLDEHVRHTGRAVEAYKAQLVAKGVLGLNADEQAVREAMAAHEPWFWRKVQAGLYPHLEPGIQPLQNATERERAFAAAGIHFTTEATSLENVIQNVLPGETAGKTIWIANAPFESKMLGAHAKGMGDPALLALKGQMEAVTAKGDPYYVTGTEVNEARIAAMRTGDWTHVWKAYLAHTPGAGKTAVRDVLDVTRAMMSYAAKLGMVELDDLYFGTSVDITNKLFRSVLGQSPQDELHRAAEDNVIQEFILKRMITNTSALQEVHENTALGREFMEAGRRGEGPIAETMMYMQRLKVLEPELRKVNLQKRLGRAVEDIIGKGHTVQVTGYGSPATMKTIGGEPLRRLPSIREEMYGMDEVIDLLKSQVGYREFDIEAEAASMLEHVGQGTNVVEKHQRLQQYLQQKTENVVDEAFARTQDIFERLDRDDAARMLTRQQAAIRGGQLVNATMESMKGRAASAWGMAVGGMAVLGGAWSLASGNAKPVRDEPSLVTYNYNEWLAYQQRMGRLAPPTQEGLAPQGISARTRGFVTDFGSPYQGIMGSQVVFMDQELLNEREKWLRQQYSAAHYDPNIGVMGIFGQVRGLAPKGYHFLGGGRAVAQGEYAGLHGQNLQQIHLQSGNWKISVQDADTITVKRGGLRGAFASFFGMNRSYSFRMAGIDAPELSHGEGSYHAPQPKAEAAAAALRSMVGKGKDTTLIYDPTQKTYGRMMGALVVDGKNVNFELVKRGLVAHLPYGKREESMIDYSRMGRMEEMAFQGRRGIWSVPYYQAFYEATEGQRPTFNTLTKKEKIVENRSLMDTVALMEQAQAQGMYSTAMATEAARIASVYHPGPDRVKPVLFARPNAHYNAFMGEMMTDASRFIKTHGTGGKQNRLSSRGSYGTLDSALALDTMGYTTSIWNKPRYQGFENYGTRDQLVAERRMRQAEMQRGVNQYIFESPIGHTRM